MFKRTLNEVKENYARIKEEEFAKADKRVERRLARGPREPLRISAEGKRSYHRFMVVLDGFLALICLFSVFLSPLAILFAWMAWNRYNKHIKAGA